MGSLRGLPVVEHTAIAMVGVDILLNHALSATDSNAPQLCYEGSGATLQEIRARTALLLGQPEAAREGSAAATDLADAVLCFKHVRSLPSRIEVAQTIQYVPAEFRSGLASPA